MIRLSDIKDAINETEETISLQKNELFRRDEINIRLRSDLKIATDALEKIRYGNHDYARRYADTALQKIQEMKMDEKKPDLPSTRCPSCGGGYYVEGFCPTCSGATKKPTEEKKTTCLDCRFYAYLKCYHGNMQGAVVKPYIAPGECCEFQPMEKPTKEE